MAKPKSSKSKHHHKPHAEVEAPAATEMQQSTRKPPFTQAEFDERPFGSFVNLTLMNKFKQQVAKEAVEEPQVVPTPAP